MKDAVATCAPRPGRFGPTLADPSTTPSAASTATTVSPGGASTQRARASSDPRSAG